MACFGSVPKAERISSIASAVVFQKCFRRFVLD